MIADIKENLECYRGISGLLDLALDYLRKTDFTGMASGKYEICGERVFVLIQEPDTRPREKARWESHRNYIDIQYIIEGAESIGFQQTAAMRPEEPYSPEKDITFYRDNQKGFFVPLMPESFVICFPQDSHMPLVCSGTPRRIRKAVVKVAVERLQNNWKEIV